MSKTGAAVTWAAQLPRVDMQRIHQAVFPDAVPSPDVTSDFTGSTAQGEAP